MQRQGATRSDKGRKPAATRLSQHISQYDASARCPDGLALLWRGIPPSHEKGANVTPPPGSEAARSILDPRVRNSNPPLDRATKLRIGKCAANESVTGRSAAVRSACGDSEQLEKIAGAEQELMLIRASSIRRQLSALPPPHSDMWVCAAVHSHPMAPSPMAFGVRCCDARHGAEGRANSGVKRPGALSSSIAPVTRCAPYVTLHMSLLLGCPLCCSTSSLQLRARFEG